MNLGIDGRVALVLGATKGIGRGIAGALTREGVRVAASSRSRERLDAVVEELGAGSGAFVADTGDTDRMANFAADVEESIGPVEILVLNTGGPPRGCGLTRIARRCQPPTASRPRRLP